MAENPKRQRTDEPQPPDKATREAIREADASEEEESYTVDTWVAGAHGWLGVEPWDVAGALSNSPKKNLTKSEVVAALKVWHAAEVIPETVEG